MRRTLPFVAAALLVAACANPADPIPDDPDTGKGAAEAGVDASAPPKDAGKDTSVKPTDGGSKEKDSSLADAGADAADNDAASDGGGVVDASIADASVGNDTCAQAVTLVDGVAANGDTSLATDTYQVDVGLSLVCDNNSSLGTYTYDGYDVAYTITVPDTKKLTVVVDPTGSWDPAVAIVTTCASVGPTCLGGADEGFSSDPETADYTNTTGSAQTVFVIVDSYSTSSHGPFTIKATLQ